MLVITGCGHSGTEYITRVLKNLGLDIGHEKMGKDGIAAWEVAAKGEPYLLPAKVYEQAYHADVVLHQVRHPLKVITSAQSIPEWPHPVWRYVSQHIPCMEDEPILLRCMKWWYWWNLMVADDLTWPHPWVYRVEGLIDVLTPFCKRVGVEPNRKALGDIPRNIGSKVGNRECVTWEDLAACDPLLCVKIQSLARSYGYEC